MGNSKMIWYLNGKFIVHNLAKVSVTDLGFGRGWGLFEYLRTYQGNPFLIDDHLNRFFKSAKLLRLTPPIPRDSLKILIRKLLGKNKFEGEVGVKIILTAGASSDGVFPSDGPTFVVMTTPLNKYPQTLYETGGKLFLTRRRRISPGIKTTDYLSALLALVEAREAGFDDVLFCTEEGEILEASRSNFFFFRSNVLFTAGRGVLPGVTRRLVINLAKKKFVVKESVIGISDLKNADEAFITSSEKEIMPVSQVGDLKIGEGKVGENTRFLMSEFRDFISDYYGKS